MRLKELKKTEPASMKSSGTDDPKKYVGKWEVYDKPQGIKARRDPKVLAMEDEEEISENSFGPENATMRFAPEPDQGGDFHVGGKEQEEIKKSRKAPLKDANRKAKALSARGQKPQLNPYRLDETIRQPFMGTLTAEYEIIDDDESSVGFARVNEGVIDALTYDTDADDEYRGHVLSALMSQIVAEADRNRANLSILVEDMDGEIKYVLERFGFRHVGKSIMKRNENAIRPASVPAPQGMINREG